MPPILVYERNKAYVMEQFHNGHFDYVEVVQEVAQRDFFRYVASGVLLDRLAETYPSPRGKEEVPTWFYLAADMAMRLHGNHAFNGFPWVISTGGLLSAFRPKVGTKSVHPQTGQLRVECKGFNAKNTYPRQTPCDPDFLRKIAKDTPADQLMAWFNGPVQQIFRHHRFYDKAGIFMGDGSYIFVPDNENYEGSAKMLFDEHNHPVGKQQAEKMSAAQLKKCQWRRCYKMISLLHTNENGDFFLYAGLRIVPGNVHECPVLWDMVDEFVSVMGKGLIKDLILDRGFLDGDAIAKAKTEHHQLAVAPIRPPIPASPLSPTSLPVAQCPPIPPQCLNRRTHETVAGRCRTGYSRNRRNKERCVSDWLLNVRKCFTSVRCSGGFGHCYYWKYVNKRTARLTVDSLTSGIPLVESAILHRRSDGVWRSDKWRGPSMARKGRTLGS